MAVDVLTDATLQALTTKTADFSSTQIDTVTGTPRRGMVARILVSAITGSALFKIQCSTTSGSGFVDCAYDPQGYISAAGERYISFEFREPNRYARLVELIGGTSQSVAYEAELATAVGG